VDGSARLPYPRAMTTREVDHIVIVPKDLTLHEPLTISRPALDTLLSNPLARSLAERFLASRTEPHGVEV
jgi:hypothetical protein